ncbi:NACHT, LRR and PYD domains-containing protein 1b allele 2-like [Xenopus tropicalis]|uniref:NACHT, LRR and PYD domains-containing protein 1b allele 2-like n=1 Tax=Xenopus tropicalis TaxID=8364 RepID=A0A8J1IUD3_XENTR|nr:NACHT, LRR and PYD domains-containing protein 1b allele 2-like [Xenopus tropicalis]
MVLETPAAVQPFYVVLKEPTFSPIGVVMMRTLPGIFRKKIPTHGAILIYCRYITGYTLHLYLVPQDPSLLKELHKKEDGSGFSWVAKPPQTNTVYSRRRYFVGGPETARINPRDLKLRFHDNPSMYPYSEIYLLDVTDEISLTVTCTQSQSAMWDVLLRRGNCHSSFLTAPAPGSLQSKFPREYPLAVEAVNQSLWILARFCEIPREVTLVDETSRSVGHFVTDLGPRCKPNMLPEWELVSGCYH